MIKDKLNLVLMCSTKGNYGFRNIYQDIMYDLFKQIDFTDFSNKITHIKDSGEEGLIEMVRFFKQFNFDIVTKPGKWKHFDSSNHIQYLKDICNVFYSNIECLSGEYTLFMESDFLLRAKKQDISYWFDYAMEILDKHNEVHQVRFSRNPEEFNRINNIKNVHPHLEWLQNHAAEWAVNPERENYLFHNEFSLCPSISRTKELHEVIKIIMVNFEKLKFHVEIGMEFAFKSIFKERLPFVCFNPDDISSVHLGEENYLELKNKWIK